MRPLKAAFRRFLLFSSSNPGPGVETREYEEPVLNTHSLPRANKDHHRRALLRRQALILVLGLVFQICCYPLRLRPIRTREPVAFTRIWNLRPILGGYPLSVRSMSIRPPTSGPIFARNSIVLKKS
jgi:hypothetical protein